MDPHKQKLLRQNMYSKQQHNKNIDENSHENKLNPTAQQHSNTTSMTDDIDNLRVPVFLNRNRRKMKELRKHLWQKQGKAEADGELQVDNGLVMRQVPQIRKLVYDAHSTDFMVYKRRRVTGDSGQNAEQIEAKRALHDYQAAQRFQKVLEMQKERLFKQNASSDEGVDQPSPSASQTNLLEIAAAPTNNKLEEKKEVDSGEPAADQKEKNKDEVMAVGDEETK